VVNKQYKYVLWKRGTHHAIHPLEDYVAPPIDSQYALMKQSEEANAGLVG
jgi:hypothetical protein